MRHAFRFRSIVVFGGVTAILIGTTAYGVQAKKTAMSYGEARDFLAKHTRLIELSDNAGARVAVAPEWQGRVMTSTCGGTAGPSFGFVNRGFIEAGKPNPQFNNYGGEERMWLCPEGGQFSLWFKPGIEQSLKNWRTPPALNEGAWSVVSKPGDRGVCMTASLRFQNASGTPFSLEASRQVRLLGLDDFQKLFGQWAAGIVTRADVKMVAYETENRIVNRVAGMSKQTGLTSIWILGMMNAGPRTIVIVPYRPGSVAELGPAAKSDYFGPVLPDRMQITPPAVLLLGDGELRSKIGVSQRRARNVLGAIDFDAGALTLVQFTMPDDPTQYSYLNNAWDLPQEKPYIGDVVSAYNDGPNDLGQRLGAFYEIESVSPAPVLKTGESLVHCHRTVHVRADAKTLAKLAKEVLGVDLERVERVFPKSRQ